MSPLIGNVTKVSIKKIWSIFCCIVCSVDKTVLVISGIILSNGRYVCIVGYAKLRLFQYKLTPSPATAPTGPEVPLYISLGALTKKWSTTLLGNPGSPATNNVNVVESASDCSEILI